MKKLLTLLFSSVLAISLALPVLGQDTGSKAPATKSTTTKTAKKHHNGKKGAKSAKKATSTTGAPTEAPK
jgi:hypothetical protein